MAEKEHSRIIAFVEKKLSPPAEAIQQQLAKILNNPEFGATKAQRAFLLFVVQKVLDGKSDDIKGYTVATEVFGRRKDFDQSTDPVVSIHANKLRRALERYYLIAGRNDPIRIDIPKGTYVPNFTRQAAVDPDAPPSGAELGADGEDLWPSLLIQPFKNLTADPAKDHLGIGFSTELAVEVARFQEIKVLFPLEEPGNMAPARQCRFVLDGNIYQEGADIKITAHLTDTKTGIQIWGDTHQFRMEASKFLAFQERVVQIIAAKTSGEFGIISQTMAVESKNKPPTKLTTYEAILRFYEYDHTLSSESFSRAMNSLENAAVIEPACGQVWSLLARLYANIYSLDFPGFVSPLEKAIEYAEKGAGINPDNQRTVATLALVRFFSNELEAAREEVNRAVELNPNSLFILDGLGYILTLSGEWQRGTALIKRVIRLNPYYRPVVHYALWLDCLHRTDYERAHMETMGFKRPAVFWYPLAKAATLGLLGRTTEAQKFVKKLLESKPDFPDKARMLIGHYVKFDDIVERIIDGLGKAGLDIV